MMELARLEQERNRYYRIAAALLYLTAVSVIAHLLQKNLIAFVLAPGALLFYRPLKSYFVFVVLGCNILFFEFFMFKSDFGPFSIQDSVILAFLFIRFFQIKDFFSYRIPVSVLLVLVYLFIIHGLIMSFVSLATMGFDPYVVMDARCVLYLSLILLLWGDPLFSPKALISLFLSIVLFASAFSVISIIAFVTTAERVVTWSEMFFSDGFIIAIVLLPVIRSPITRRFLFVCAVLCFMALLTTQTRAIWLWTAISALLYCCILLIKNKNVRIMKIVRLLSIVFLVLLVTQMLLVFTVNLNLATYISGRMFHGSNNEFTNAGTSIGYRMYESFMVWRNKTLFGHGSGARILLLFTQWYPPRFIKWWAIHSGYFDLLHKYGFVGLGLYISIILLILKRGVFLMRTRKRITQTFGTIVFLTLLNHAAVSITSQCFFRENVMIYIVLLIGIVEYYGRPLIHKAPA